MRFLSYLDHGKPAVAVRRGGEVLPLSSLSPDLPRDLLALLEAGEPALNRVKDLLRAGKGSAIDPTKLVYLPPLPAPPRIMCVGLNYADHAAETKFEVPKYPVLFPRFTSTLVAHGQPLIKPRLSDAFDYEVELVAIIGKTVRHVSKEKALDYVAGYSVFNDASVRDYQFRTTQFTQGKNFDGSGAFGPDFVTADEVPPGGRGLTLTTKLNGKTLQSASTVDLIFDVATLVSLLSEFMTLVPGDVIVTGTPGGVGYTRTPPIFMKQGDVCDCEVEGVGLLSNPIRNEA